MTDKQQELKKIHKRISQIQLMVKQLGEYVGWQEGQNLLSNNKEENLFMSDTKPSSDFQSNPISCDNFSNNSDFPQHHKDILIDDDSFKHKVYNYSNCQDNISCEEKVNRLTAQLTAAYYRIAALEDQLFSARNHQESRDNSFYNLQ